MPWRVELTHRKLTFEDASLYSLLFAIERTLNHPVQVFDNEIRHAGTAEAIGTIRRIKEPQDRELEAIRRESPTRHHLRIS